MLAVDAPDVRDEPDDAGALIHYAWKRLVIAYRVATVHYPIGTLCACKNPLPCVHAETVEPYAVKYEGAWAALAGDTAVFPVVAPAFTQVDEPPSTQDVNQTSRWRRRFWFSKPGREG